MRWAVWKEEESGEIDVKEMSVYITRHVQFRFEKGRYRSGEIARNKVHWEHFKPDFVSVNIRDFFYVVFHTESVIL